MQGGINIGKESIRRCAHGQAHFATKWHSMGNGGQPYTEEEEDEWESHTSISECTRLVIVAVSMQPERCLRVLAPRSSTGIDNPVQRDEQVSRIPVLSYK